MNTNSIWIFEVETSFLSCSSLSKILQKLKTTEANLVVSLTFLSLLQIGWM